MNKIHDAAIMILHARHLVAFTGAGISTPSGIPDFRSAGTGLWHQNDPMEVASLSVFNQYPTRFYDWYRPLLRAATSAYPNPAHDALADLERRKIVRSVITQNIDGLHQAAGSKEVIELHGSMKSYECARCKTKGENTDEINICILAGNLPVCQRCGGILKPGITLFEESLPATAWQKAEAEMEKADVLLIAGTSLEVIPASTLPWKAYQNGAKLVMINLSSTELDGFSQFCIREDVAKVLPKLRDLLLGK